ncbi:MAG: NuA4 histone acetyltransferase subunit [Phylliscum demangeonii]|nr:MAG: NuA4 histone acetyltransferase subunit [Phylliscum demangeonii]
MTTVLNSSIPPSNTEYGGDEISAIVLDAGYSSVRAGFAGEDVPKSVVPSYYGTVSSKLLFGDNSVHTPLPGLSIQNPMALDGTVEDWNTAEKLWQYAITSRLTNARAGNPATNGLNDALDDVDLRQDAMSEIEKPMAEHPLFMTEPGWNPVKARELCIEIALEDWGCPAFWMGRNAMLAAYSAGKASALVVDVGASTLSVTPVHDGFVLRKGVVKSHLAGDFVSQQARRLFATSQPAIRLVPHYLVSSKSPVDAGAPANAVYRTFAEPPHESFRQLEEERVMTEFKESVVQIWGGPGRLTGGQGSTTNEEVVKGFPGRPFEMPDGWNQVFGWERFRVAEGIFDAKMAMTAPEAAPISPDQTLPSLIQASLNAVDPDIRPHLLVNVVVTGGSSLLYGFTERLNTELMQIYPGSRIRVSAPGNTAERKFGSWIGGSILASLGTFHQLWISKAEYEEHGIAILEKRCK